MIASFLRKGNTIEETAEAGIVAGQVELKGGKAAVAVSDYAAGDRAAWKIDGIIKGLFTVNPSPGDCGEPVWYDAALDKFSLIPKVDPGDFYAGILVVDMAAEATSGDILLNGINNDLLLDVFCRKIPQIKTDNYTIVEEDTGKLLIMLPFPAADKTFTLPNTAGGALSGLELLLVNLSPAGTAALNISPHIANKIIGPDVPGVIGKDWINPAVTAKRWDYLQINADGAAGWYVNASRGVWTQES